MIEKYVALLAVAFLLPAAAFAQSCTEPWSFDRSFSGDPPGGEFLMGEDEAVSASFDGKARITAHFQILTPHRTDTFGSGVAFWLCSEDGMKALRVSFGDKEGQDQMSLKVYRFNNLDDPDAKTDTLAESTLSIPKRSAAKVMLKKDAKGKVTIQVDGQSIRVDTGFIPSRVQVQIFCAKAWAQFADVDASS